MVVLANKMKVTGEHMHGDLATGEVNEMVIWERIKDSLEIIGGGKVHYPDNTAECYATSL